MNASVTHVAMVEPVETFQVDFCVSVQKAGRVPCVKLTTMSVVGDHV